MLTLKQIIFACVLVLALLSTAAAQDSTSASAQRSTLTITASASGERVRITAPSSIVQMHVEVYAPGGEKLFDQEIRGGNVFDWHLQDGQAQRLAPGAYVCVVTAKSISGKLTQKIGTVRVEQNSASVQPAESLSAPQAQTIGPVEENSSWTIPGRDEPQTPTVIANDGTDGQMIRGRGALTFRIGDFFSGIDTEQMRLTEAGNLGIGTSEPNAKLDVAGTIRAERFLIAKPKLASGDKTASLAADSGDSVHPLATGSGTQDQIAKWADNSGLLGNSGITETAAGNVGIGTTGPGYKLEVNGGVGVNSTLTFNLATGITPIDSIVGGKRWQIGQNVGGGSSNDTFGLYSYTAGKRLWQASGSGDLSLQPDSGNVGIGTASPGAQLDVVNPISSSLLRIKSTSGGVAVLQLDAPNTSSYIDFNNAGVNKGEILYYHPTNYMAFNTNGSEKVRINTNGNVGIGTASPGYKLEVNGGVGVNSTLTFNLATGITPIDSIVGGKRWQIGQNVGGGSSNDTFGLYSYTAGKRLWQASGSGDLSLQPDSGNVGIGTTNPQTKLDVAGDVLFENKWRTETTVSSPNLIGGFLGTGSGGAKPGNRVTAGVVGATIGGGGFNGVIAFPSGGGFSGDLSNRVTDWFGTVGGGHGNRAGNDDATLDNAFFATVAGGEQNTASGNFATVGGGYSNTASGYAATVGGGFDNTANNEAATVGGGLDNTASNRATVGGGFFNTASGYGATVPGGNSNTASGDYSLAAGRLAKANHPGTFVWADSIGFDFASTGNDQFLIRARGGVGIGTNAPTAQLHVDGGSICLGPYCDNGNGRIIAGGSGAEITFLDRGATSFVNGPANGERWLWYSINGRARLWSGSDKLSVDPSGVLRVLGAVQPSTTPDIAETIAADSSVTAADVVCADPLHRERAVRCSKNDRAILGVISDGTGGFLINSNAKSTDAPLTGMPLVLAGRVPVKVSLENGPIQIGDFLAPSSTPGVAMRAGEPGPTIGIALEAFNPETKGARAKPQTGTVLCFIKAGQGDISATLARMNQDNKRLEQQQQDQIAALRTANTALNARLRLIEQTLKNKRGPIRQRH